MLTWWILTLRFRTRIKKALFLRRKGIWPRGVPRINSLAEQYSKSIDSVSSGSSNRKLYKIVHENRSFYKYQIFLAVGIVLGVACLVLVVLMFATTKSLEPHTPGAKRPRNSEGVASLRGWRDGVPTLGNNEGVRFRIGLLWEYEETTRPLRSGLGRSWQ